MFENCVFFRKKFLESLRVFSAFQYPGNTHHPLPRTSGASPGSGVTGTTCRCYFGILWKKLKISNSILQNPENMVRNGTWQKKANGRCQTPEKADIHTQQVLTEDRQCNLYKKWAVSELFSLVCNRNLPKSAVFQMSPYKKTLNESWSRILFNVALFLLISWLFIVAYSMQRVLFHGFTVNFLFEDLRN